MSGKLSQKIFRIALRHYASESSSYDKQASICNKKKPDPMPGTRDPDLSRFEGDKYRTCGPGYVIQRDVIPPCDTPQSDEERILKKIEAVPGTKESIQDPMPPFRSVEQRLIDLTERKLHPSYRKYMEMPKDMEVTRKNDTGIYPYKCKSGPIEAEEIPDIFKFNKSLLEKKNIFADFKMVELPKQMLVRMVEMEKNRKPTLEKKKEYEEKKEKEEKK